MDEFIISVYVVVDDLLKAWKADWGLTSWPWRRRGPAPTLSDSEVLTMELVGEFCRLDTDKGIYTYFCQHGSELFPALPRVHRTTFVRQATRLAAVKQALWRLLLDQLPHDGTLSVVDSFPLDVCQLARASRCRRFAGEAAYGYDELIKQTFYGFRWHVRVGWPGVICEVEVAAANLSDTTVVEQLLERAPAGSVVLGDRNYWSPTCQTQVREELGVRLLAPFRRRQGGPPEGRWPRWLTQMRRRIETVIGQLVERYQAKRTWARDGEHLLNRVLRKVLSHTICLWLNRQRGHEAFLQLDALMAN